MSIKHTPEKWSHDMFNEHDIPQFYIQDENLKTVAQIFMDGNNSDQAESRTKLIAQSPPMHLFITEFVSALKDKSKLSTWEKALLLSAEEILKKIDQ